MRVAIRYEPSPKHERRAEAAERRTIEAFRLRQRRLESLRDYYKYAEDEQRIAAQYGKEAYSVAALLEMDDEG